MKKLFFILTCAALSLTASAQRASSSSTSFFSSERVDGGAQFGIQAGMNMAGISDCDLDSSIAFNAGITLDLLVVRSFYVKSGLFFTMKGAKYDEDGLEITASPMYIELPILASYRLNFSDNLQWELNVGPYVAYGVGGKEKVEYRGEKEDYDFFGDEGAKRFDAGLQFGTGFTFGGHYTIGVAYEMGLTKLADEGKSKNNNFMVNLGYKF